MIRKSVPSFVLALIAGILSAYIGFYVAWISILIGAFGGTEYLLFLIAGWACIIGGVVGIVGGSFCFRKANIGAIILTVVTATAGVALVWVFFKIMIASGAVTAEDGAAINPGLVMGILTLAPVVMYVVATICAYLAKPTEPNEPKSQFAYNVTPKVQVANEQTTQNAENQTSNDIKRD